MQHDFFNVSPLLILVTLFIAEDRERVQGVSTVNNDEESLNKIKSYGFTYSEVQSKTLNEILNEPESNCKIDFISIDVERTRAKRSQGFPY